MIDRRAFISSVILGLILLAAPLAAEAQPAGKVWTVGLLSAVTSTSAQPAVAGLRAGLREAGYVEGSNVLLHPRWGEGSYESLDALARELVGLKVDVMVVWGTPAILAAKRATSVIPIVMASAGDAVAHGLIVSLARPGGNAASMWN